MAEMDVYHEQKIEDIKLLVGDYLDGEIALYEQVCSPFLLPLSSLLYNLTRLIDLDSSQIRKQQAFLRLYHFIGIGISSPTFNPRKRSRIA
jgi:hypothetical protein